jgi:hypothetical protein
MLKKRNRMEYLSQFLADQDEWFWNFEGKKFFWMEIFF